MPKTTQNILLEDLYRTKTSSAISSSGDISFTVTTPPQNKKGYILLEPDNDSKREKMFYHDVSGNTIYVKGVNRIGATDHIIGVNVQINDTALIFNHLFEQDASTFYCEKTGSLSLNVWGGPVLQGITTLSVADTPITITNNVTNYIYYKSATNQILSNTSESAVGLDNGIIVAEVVAASGVITSIKYRNHKFSVGNYISSIVETNVSGRTHTYTITFTDGTTFDYDILDGKSAYEVALDEGFIGSEVQWLASLRGERGVNWRGAFNIGTAYTPFDLISYQGSTYINILGSTGVLPTNPTNFEIFASAGEVTLAGVQTLTNKTISGANNTLTNIAQSSVTNLATDLAGKANLSGGNTFSGGTQSVSVSSGTGVSVSSTATGLANHGLSVNTANIGNANGLLVYDNSNRSTGIFPLVEINQDNANSIAPCVKIKNDGPGSALDLTGTLTVNGQNWTSAWTSYTPAVTGSGGGIGTFVGLNTSYELVGKALTYEGNFGVTSKGSLSGDVLIQVPFTLKNNGREFIKADSSFVGAVGTSLTTQSTVIGIQPGYNSSSLIIATTFASAYTTWASIPDGTWFSWRITCEIA